MRALWLVAVVGSTVSCGNTVTVVCDLPTFAASDLAGRSAIVCDDAAANPDGGAAGGQDCVIAALAAGSAFSFSYAVPNAVNDLRAQWIGYPQPNGRMTVHIYGFSGDRPGVAGDAHPTVSVASCAGTPAITKTPNCTPSDGHPCLACNQPLGAALLCGVQP